MERNYFVYSVDFVTVSGRLDSVLMILDKNELKEVVSTLRQQKCAITGVNCAMYDKYGFPVKDRDVTHLFKTSSNN